MRSASASRTRLCSWPSTTPTEDRRDRSAASTTQRNNGLPRNGSTNLFAPNRRESPDASTTPATADGATASIATKGDPMMRGVTLVLSSQFIRGQRLLIGLVSVLSFARKLAQAFQYFFRSERRRCQSNSGRVIDRVGDCRQNSGHATLADFLGAVRLADNVLLGNHIRIVGRGHLVDRRHAIIEPRRVQRVAILCHHFLEEGMPKRSE